MNPMGIIIMAISNLVFTMHQHLKHFLNFLISAKIKPNYAIIIGQYNGGKTEIETLNMVFKMQCTNIGGHIKISFNVSTFYLNSS